MGTIVQSGFDLRSCVFSFKLNAHQATTEGVPTEIVLPEFHFPKDKCEVDVSSGKWAISTYEEDGGLIQKLRWWHAEGEQSIKVTGVARVQQMGREDDVGYYDQCQQNKCTVM